MHEVSACQDPDDFSGTSIVIDTAVGTGADSGTPGPNNKRCWRTSCSKPGPAELARRWAGGVNGLWSAERSRALSFRGALGDETVDLLEVEVMVIVESVDVLFSSGAAVIGIVRRPVNGGVGGLDVIAVLAVLGRPIDERVVDAVEEHDVDAWDGPGPKLMGRFKGEGGWVGGS
jgi:hypothetical protein